MFEKVTPDEWRQFAGVIITLIGGVSVLVLGIAGWTLRYIIRIARSTSKTETACTSINQSLNTFQTQNEQDHRDIHNRIDGVELVQINLGNKVAEHGVEISNIKGARQ